MVTSAQTHKLGGYSCAKITIFPLSVIHPNTHLRRPRGSGVQVRNSEQKKNFAWHVEICIPQIGKERPLALAKIETFVGVWSKCGPMIGWTLVN